MKILALLTVSAAVLVSSSAFAQGLTRAEVRQQLVEAQQNGSEYVTDASYPDVSPAFQNQLAHRQQNANAYGGVAAMVLGVLAIGLGLMFGGRVLLGALALLIGLAAFLPPYMFQRTACPDDRNAKS